MLKKRIATVAVAGLATLGIGHAVLAATEITGSNHVEDSDTTTGDANSQNSAAVLNGQFGGPNFQDGDNEAELGQDANSSSGDGVNGQVIGAVDGSGGGSGSGQGGTSVNASNSCEDCDSTTGDSNANNNAAVVNGQVGGPNAQEGDNETEVDQDADSQSGDANNGQVIGVVS